MKKLILLVLLAGMMLVQGCMLTQEQINGANYGPYPTRYKELIQDHFVETLIDPESVRYDWRGKPFRAITNIITYGWFVRVNINAKNSCGGYTGKTPFTILMRYDRLLLAEESGIFNMFNVFHYPNN